MDWFVVVGVKFWSRQGREVAPAKIGPSPGKDQGQETTTTLADQSAGMEFRKTSRIFTDTVG